MDGTLYYDGDGNVFDQILVGKPLLKGDGPFGIVDGTARVDAFPEMVSSSVSRGPIRFGLPKGDADNVDTNGYSDHFPVSVMVEENEGVT